MLALFTTFQKNANSVMAAVISCYRKTEAIFVTTESLYLWRWSIDSEILPLTNTPLLVAARQVGSILFLCLVEVPFLNRKPSTAFMRHLVVTIRPFYSSTKSANYFLEIIEILVSLAKEKSRLSLVTSRVVGVSSP